MLKEDFSGWLWIMFLRESPECHIETFRTIQKHRDFPLCFWKRSWHVVSTGLIQFLMIFSLMCNVPIGCRRAHVSELVSLQFLHLVIQLASFYFSFSVFFYGRRFLLAFVETALTELLCTEIISPLSSRSIKRSCLESLEKELPAAGLVSDAKWLALLQPSSLVFSQVVMHRINSSHVFICRRPHIILQYSDY